MLTILSLPEQTNISFMIFCNLLCSDLHIYHFQLQKSMESIPNISQDLHLLCFQVVILPFHSDLCVCKQILFCHFFEKFVILLAHYFLKWLEIKLTIPQFPRFDLYPHRLQSIPLQLLNFLYNEFCC